MRKLLLISLLSPLFILGACDSTPTIFVGATPSPHAEILNSEVIKNFIESKGYKLEVKVYQDYVTPNKALNDGGIDANYFQHTPYLTEEVDTKGYTISSACEVHNEPLNLYSKNSVTDFSNKKISIINDASNVERAFKLLKANDIISSYNVDDFNAQHPIYESSIGVSIECVDPGLLAKKVDDDGLAVIPGNYALTAWGSSKASTYKVLGEDKDVAYPNIIAVRTSDLNNEKTNVLVEALSQEGVKTYIENSYGPTVNYCFKDTRN